MQAECVCSGNLYWISAALHFGTSFSPETIFAHPRECVLQNESKYSWVARMTNNCKRLQVQSPIVSRNILLSGTSLEGDAMIYFASLYHSCVCVIASVAHAIIMVYRLWKISHLASLTFTFLLNALREFCIAILDLDCLVAICLCERVAWYRSNGTSARVSFGLERYEILTNTSWRESNSSAIFHVPPLSLSLPWVFIGDRNFSNWISKNTEQALLRDEPARRRHTSCTGWCWWH